MACPQVGRSSGGGEGRRERSGWWDEHPSPWAGLTPATCGCSVREARGMRGSPVSARPLLPLSGFCLPFVLSLPLSFWIIRESALIGAFQARAPQEPRHSKRPPRSREFFPARMPWLMPPAARRPCQPLCPRTEARPPRTAPRGDRECPHPHSLAPAGVGDVLPVPQLRQHCGSCHRLSCPPGRSEPLWERR